MTMQPLDDEIAQKNTAEARQSTLASITPDAKRKAETQFEKFSVAYRSHKEYVKEAQIYNAFYMGDQWNEDDKKKLKAEGRPYLTINKILSIINTLMNEQIERRVDVQFKADRDSNEESAKAMSQLAMAISQANMLDDVESEVFEDGLIMERGYFDVRMNFEQNIQGDVEISSLHPLEVIPDQQTNHYDPAKWNEVYISRWQSLEQIATFYGDDARKKVEALVGVEGSLGKESIRYESGDDIETMGDSHLGETPEDLPEDEMRRIKSIRVIERQFYKLKRVFWLVDPRTGRKRELPSDTSEEIAERMGQKYGFFVMRGTQRRMYWTVTADRVLLFDDWSPYKTFTVVPYFPYFRHGKPMGVVRNLISPQEQYNKISSQELHIVNSTANSGYIVEDGALSGMTADDLEKKGAKTGVVITVHKNRKDGIEKLKPNPIPTGVLQAKESARTSMGEISSLSDAFMGGNSSEVSGVALKNKDDRGQAQTKKPTENLNRTRRLLWRKVRELVKEFYTDERVLMITDEFQPGQPATELAINTPDPETGEVRNDVTAGDMSIHLSLKPSRESFNDHQFAQIINLRQAGVMIPDHWVVRYSDLYKKDELAAELVAQGQPSPEMQQIQMQQLMLQLKDMDATVQEKLAKVIATRMEALFTQVKAKNEILEPEFRQAALDLQLQEMLESGEVRRDLAKIQSINKLDSEDVKIRGKLLEKIADAKLAPKQEKTPNA